MSDNVLRQLQARLVRGTQETARFLGLSRGAFYRMREGKDPIAPTILRSAEAHLLLTDAQLHGLVEKRLAESAANG